MNLLSFTTSKSSLQYDGYKYKVDFPISYSGRRLYKYKLDEVLYDLRNSSNFKYLLKVEVDSKNWERFKKGDWEYYLTSLNLLELIQVHLKGLINFNKFTEVLLPSDLEDSTYLSEFKLINPTKLGTRKLVVTWFEEDIDLSLDPNTHVNLVIFNT